MHRKGFEIGAGVDAGHLEKMLLARKVGAFLARSDEDPGERAVVQKLARMLAADVSVEVRQAMAFEIRRAPDLPKDVARTIARDVEDIAAPFIEMTEALDEQDWLDLLEELEDFAVVAMARRNDLTTTLCERIVETRSEKPVTVLVRNSKAPLSERACEIVLNRFESQQNLLEVLALRETLPLHLVEKIAALVSENTRQRLASKYRDQEQALAQPTKQASVSTLVHWLETASRPRIEVYVRELDDQGRLTDSHIINVCRGGDLRLLESAVAYKTGLPIGNVEKIIRSGLERGLERLFRKANFSDGTNSLLRATVRHNLTRLDFS